MSEQESKISDNSYTFFKKVVIVIVMALAVTLFILFIGRAISTLLIIFGGLCLGIIFRASRDIIHRLTHLPEGLSLAVVVILFFSGIFGIGYGLGPQIYQQGSKVYEQLPARYNKLQKKISAYDWGKELINENPHFKDLFENENNGTGEDHDMTKRVLQFLGGIAYLAAALLLAFVTAIYIAAEPELYSEGFVRLFHQDRRKQVVDIMDEISLSIQWWLVGQICSMLLLGIITTAGLYLLGVPSALLLGIFTALMTFIPNLGPIIAAIPTLLVSLTVGVDTAIYVLIFYTVLQSLEGYFITPMIHRNAIDVPPMLIIVIQFLLYYLVGILAVFLAMPLIACGMVLVKRLYIQDLLGDPLEERTDYEMEGDSIV